MGSGTLKVSGCPNTESRTLHEFPSPGPDPSSRPNPCPGTLRISLASLLVGSSVVFPDSSPQQRATPTHTWTGPPSTVGVDPPRGTSVRTVLQGPRTGVGGRNGVSDVTEGDLSVPPEGPSPCRPSWGPDLDYATDVLPRPGLVGSTDVRPWTPGSGFYLRLSIRVELVQSRVETPRHLSFQVSPGLRRCSFLSRPGLPKCSTKSSRPLPLKSDRLR